MDEISFPVVSHRYDFCLLYDVINGNPNGDPDAGNAPRIDPETGHGLVSDVCLKRKIRNFVSVAKSDPAGNPAPGYDIYVKHRAILNQQHDRAYHALGLKIDEKESRKRLSYQEAARRWMCQTYFDVRTFGAVMTTGANCGQVRGPVQVAFSTSVSPIVELEQAITRVAVTTEKDSEKQGGVNQTMGRKGIVPYGLYRVHGFINPFFAAQTGFNEADLELLWQALHQMFEVDRSASHGEMSVRGLYVFQHQSRLGNAPAHRLFERIEVRQIDAAKPPRKFSDYRVTTKFEQLPAGVSVEQPLSCENRRQDHQRSAA
jgi:CRISPR-associated protein Csd2